MLPRTPSRVQTPEDHVAGHLAFQLQLETLIPKSARAATDHLYRLYIGDLTWVNKILVEQLSSPPIPKCPRPLFEAIIRHARDLETEATDSKLPSYLGWCGATLAAISAGAATSTSLPSSVWQHSHGIRMFAMPLLGRSSRERLANTGAVAPLDLAISAQLEEFK